MSQIEQLQGRIANALDRISRGLEGLEAPVAPSPVPDDLSEEVAALQAALEEERTANAQMEDRIATLKARADAAEQAAPAEEIAALAAQMRSLDTEVQRLRRANDQLRASNAALREANEAGVGEPHLINSAMLAELEALRATRAVDSAELSAILEALGPLVPQQPEGA